VNEQKREDKNQAEKEREEASGRVRFDDRGNAVWETWRGRRLEHPGLAIADEEPTPNSPVPINTKGGRIGYDPYQSGMLKRKKEDLPKKKDLRALSQWIQMQKALGQKG
jgi:hypothetical protein